MMIEFSAPTGFNVLAVAGSRAGHDRDVAYSHGLFPLRLPSKREAPDSGEESRLISRAWKAGACRARTYVVAVWPRRSRHARVDARRAGPLGDRIIDRLLHVVASRVVHG